MLTVRKSDARGHADHGWLKSQHTFSFADYHDPEHMAFSALRVINEDWVAGGTGFPTHPHKDMEIVTYVISGVLAHKDTLNNAAEIRPGDVQRMTAGSGIRHSEFNASENEEVHLLQIWILPNKKDLPPGYEQKNFLDQLEKNNFVLVASPDGREGSVTINQDVNLYVGRYHKGDEKQWPMKGRRAWVQIVKGEIQANGQKLVAGDGLAVEDEKELVLKASQDAEFLFFDLP